MATAAITATPTQGTMMTAPLELTDQEFCEMLEGWVATPADEMIVNGGSDEPLKKQESQKGFPLYYFFFFPFFLFLHLR